MRARRRIRGVAALTIAPFSGEKKDACADLTPSRAICAGNATKSAPARTSSRAVGNRLGSGEPR